MPDIHAPKNAFPAATGKEHTTKDSIHGKPAPQYGATAAGWAQTAIIRPPTQG